MNYCPLCGAEVESAELDLNAAPATSGKVGVGSPPLLRPCGHATFPVYLESYDFDSQPQAVLKANVDSIRTALLSPQQSGRALVNRELLLLLLTLADISLDHYVGKDDHEVVAAAQ